MPFEAHHSKAEDRLELCGFERIAVFSFGQFFCASDAPRGKNAKNHVLDVPTKTRLDVPGKRRPARLVCFE
jgi:hypothetical protein